MWTRMTPQHREISPAETSVKSPFIHLEVLCGLFQAWGFFTRSQKVLSDIYRSEVSHGRPCLKSWNVNCPTESSRTATKSTSCWDCFASCWLKGLTFSLNFQANIDEKFFKCSEKIWELEHEQFQLLRKFSICKGWCFLPEVWTLWTVSNPDPFRNECTYTYFSIIKVLSSNVLYQ